MGQHIDKLMQQYNIGSGASTMGYSHGGGVRTHYQTGGPTALPGDPLQGLESFYSNPANLRPVMPDGLSGDVEGFYRDRRNFGAPARPGRLSYQAQMRMAEPPRLPERRLMPIESVGGGFEDLPVPLPAVAAAPAAPQVTGPEPIPAEAVGQPEPAAAQAGPATRSPIEALLQRYMSGSGEGARELAAARQRSQTESEAFYNLVRQMAERGESPTSRSELYFRLAAAFGSPTRTGKLSESLSLAGKEMGEYVKGQRAEESERRGLLLKAQEARMAGAREDLATSRALAAQEASERAAVSRELIKEYIKSGEPQTEAEREARALGLTGQARADFIRRAIISKVEAAEAKALQLAPNEQTDLRNNRELVDRTSIAIEDLRRAIALNPRTLPGGLLGQARYRIGTATGSEAEIVQNTEQLQNILGRITVDSLKATFPGAISNAEREALAALSGATSASLASRERIMRDALRRLETMVENANARIQRIQTGADRYIEPGALSRRGGQ